MDGCPLLSSFEAGHSVCATRAEKAGRLIMRTDGITITLLSARPCPFTAPSRSRAQDIDNEKKDDAGGNTWASGCAKQDQTRACGEVYLDKVAAAVPRERRGKELAGSVVDAPVAAKCLVVAVQSNAVRSWLVDANAVVCAGGKGGGAAGRGGKKKAIEKALSGR